MCLLTKCFRSSTLTGAAEPAKSQCEESDAFPYLFMAFFIKVGLWWAPFGPRVIMEILNGIT